MEVRDELHASAALLPAKSLPVAQKTGWSPQQVWTVLRRQKSLDPAGWVLSRSSSRCPFHYTQYATPAAPRLSLCHINWIPVLYVLSHYHLTPKYSNYEIWLLKEFLPGPRTLSKCIRHNFTIQTETHIFSPADTI